jgi:hypothetical protein
VLKTTASAKIIDIDAATADPEEIKAHIQKFAEQGISIADIDAVILEIMGILILINYYEQLQIIYFFFVKYRTVVL